MLLSTYSYVHISGEPYDASYTNNAPHSVAVQLSPLHMVVCRCTKTFDPIESNPIQFVSVQQTLSQSRFITNSRMDRTNATYGTAYDTFIPILYLFIFLFGGACEV